MDHGIYPLKNPHQRVSSDDNSNGSSGPKVEVDSFLDRDEREMAILGKRQQLKVGHCSVKRSQMVLHSHTSIAELRIHEYSWFLLYFDGDLGGHVLVSGRNQSGMNRCRDLTVFAVFSCTALPTADRRVWCTVISFVGLVILRSLYL